MLKKIEAELQEKADAKAKEWAKESSFDGSKTGEQIHADGTRPSTGCCTGTWRPLIRPASMKPKGGGSCGRRG